MTVYYVDGAIGNDGNDGLAEGSSNAWATIDKAMNTVIAGDKVWVKASATYTETPNIDTAGASTTEIVFEGYTTTTGDNGKVTIDGESTRSFGLTGSTSSTYYIFANFIWQNHTSHGVFLGAPDVVMFYNCEFNNNGGSGMLGDNSMNFVNCVADGNAVRGIDTDGGSSIGGIYINNGQEQYLCLSTIVFYRNVCGKHTNATDAVCSLGSGFFIGGNTIDGGNVATQGINAVSFSQYYCVDNIIYDSALGLDAAASFNAVNGFVGYNLMNSNTTDYDTVITDRPFLPYQDASGAPSFTDEANGDYTLSDSSPAINTGIQPGGIT